MKNNCQIHLRITSELKEKLLKQARDEDISFAEVCRRKLKENDKLDIILSKLNSILEKK